MQRILYVVTHGISARNLLRGQLRWMRERGHTVAVASAGAPSSAPSCAAPSMPSARPDTTDNPDTISRRELLRGETHIPFSEGEAEV